MHYWTGLYFLPVSSSLPPREALYSPTSLIGHVTCFMQYNSKLMCFSLAKALEASLCFNYFLFFSATSFQKALLLQPGCQSEEDMEQSLLQMPMDTWHEQGINLCTSETLRSWGAFITTSWSCLYNYYAKIISIWFSFYLSHLHLPPRKEWKGKAKRERKEKKRPFCHIKTVLSPAAYFTS